MFSARYHGRGGWRIADFVVRLHVFAGLRCTFLALATSRLVAVDVFEGDMPTLT